MRTQFFYTLILGFFLMHSNISVAEVTATGPNRVITHGHDRAVAANDSAIGDRAAERKFSGAIGTSRVQPAPTPAKKITPGEKGVEKLIGSSSSNCTILTGRLAASFLRITKKTASAGAEVAVGTALTALAETISAIITGGASAGFGIVVGGAKIVNSAVEGVNALVDVWSEELPHMCQDISLFQSEKCCENSKGKIGGVCAKIHSMPQDLCKVGGCLVTAAKALASPSAARYEKLKNAGCCQAIQDSKNLPAKVKHKFVALCDAAARGFDKAEQHFNDTGHRIARTSIADSHQADAGKSHADADITVGNANYNCQCKKIAD